jgi:hypothetical protein
MSLGIGIINISIKHFIDMLLKKMNRLTKKNVMKENLLTENVYNSLIKQ